MKQNEQARSSSRLFIPPQKPESGTTNMQSFFSTKMSKEVIHEEQAYSKEEIAKKNSRYKFTKEAMEATPVRQSVASSEKQLENELNIIMNEEPNLTPTSEVNEVSEDEVNEIATNHTENVEISEKTMNELRGKSIHAMTKEEKIKFLINKPKYIPKIPCLFLTKGNTFIGYVKEQIRDSIVIDLITDFNKVTLKIDEILEIHPYVTNK